MRWAFAAHEWASGYGQFTISGKIFSGISRIPATVAMNIFFRGFPLRKKTRLVSVPATSGGVVKGAAVGAAGGGTLIMNRRRR
ncbi:hypothetical protein [Streptomyces sp. SM13]|uniref:hypothetical protein n=1 Tax=Streptomyces sp. SM13 TaxID=1983803 RepID=UPI0011B09830|nr:hypothetical protein [Streptomyces sp. SM13]